MVELVMTKHGSAESVGLNPDSSLIPLQLASSTEERRLKNCFRLI